MAKKKFHRQAAEIRLLIPDLGFGLATDRIMVDGARVGVMYREEPEEEGDSGWFFLHGDESQAYLDDAKKCGLYSLNTLANYDPAIIAFLSYPPGSRIERRDGALEVVEGPDEEPDITFLAAADAGSVRLTADWSATLTETMLRRVEDGNLVLWRPGLTAFFSVFDVGPSEARKELVAEFLAEADESRFDEHQDLRGPVWRARYRLQETDAEDGERSGLYGIAVTAKSKVVAAVYFDEESDIETAMELIDSLAAK